MAADIKAPLAFLVGAKSRVADTQTRPMGTRLYAHVSPLASLLMVLSQLAVSQSREYIFFSSFFFLFSFSSSSSSSSSSFKSHADFTVRGTAIHLYAREESAARICAGMKWNCFGSIHFFLSNFGRSFLLKETLISPLREGKFGN